MWKRKRTESFHLGPCEAKNKPVHASTFGGTAVLRRPKAQGPPAPLPACQPLCAPRTAQPKTSRAKPPPSCFLNALVGLGFRDIFDRYNLRRAQKSGRRQSRTHCKSSFDFSLQLRSAPPPQNQERFCKSALAARGKFCIYIYNI